jgi:hypothetical protein
MGMIIAAVLSSCSVEYKVISSEGRALSNRGSEDDDDLRIVKVYKIKLKNKE